MSSSCVDGTYADKTQPAKGPTSHSALVFGEGEVLELEINLAFLPTYNSRTEACWARLSTVLTLNLFYAQGSNCTAKLKRLPPYLWLYVNGRCCEDGIVVHLLGSAQTVKNPVRTTGHFHTQVVFSVFVRTLQHVVGLSVQFVYSPPCNYRHLLCLLYVDKLRWLLRFFFQDVVSHHKNASRKHLESCLKISWVDNIMFSA